jgi:hypothetical protein
MALTSPYIGNLGDFLENLSAQLFCLSSYKQLHYAPLLYFPGTQEFAVWESQICTRVADPNLHIPSAKFNASRPTPNRSLVLPHSPITSLYTAHYFGDTDSE